jgi:hypothetical protein
LGVRSQFERIFGTLETHPGERESECIIRFFEDAARHGILRGKALAHAGELRSLSGKKEGCRWCQRRL